MLSGTSGTTGTSGNNHGGARPGAGRKSRGDEEELQAILKAGWPRTQRIAAIKKVAERAAKGDLRSAQFLFEYAYGKPKERREVTGADGGPVAFTIDDALNKVYGDSPASSAASGPGASAAG